MKPDQAISKLAFDAADLLDAYGKRGGTGDPKDLAAVLFASLQGIMLAAGMFEKASKEPGHMNSLTPEMIAHVRDQAHAAASGVLLVCSIMPGVEDIPEIPTH